MADEISTITRPIQFRFLEELDQPDKLREKGKGSYQGEKGIRTHHNLGLLDRLFGWLKGDTVEVKAGNKAFILSRRSLEDFLIRNDPEVQAADLATRSWAGKYTFLVERLQDFMAKKKVAIAQAADKLNVSKDTSDKTKLKKDMYNALLGNEIKLSFTAFKDLTVNFKDVTAALQAEVNPAAPPLRLRDREVTIPLSQAPGIPSSSLSGPVAVIVRAVLEQHIPQQPIDPPIVPPVEPVVLPAEPAAPAPTPAAAHSPPPTPQASPQPEPLEERERAQREQAAKEAAARARTQVPQVNARTQQPEASRMGYQKPPAPSRAAPRKPEAAAAVPPPPPQRSAEPPVVSREIPLAPAERAPEPFQRIGRGGARKPLKGKKPRFKPLEHRGVTPAATKPPAPSQAVAPLPPPPAPPPRPTAPSEPSLSMLQQEEATIRAQVALQSAQVNAGVTKLRAVQEKAHKATIQELHRLFETQKALFTAEIHDMPWHTVSMPSDSEFVLRSYQPKTGEGTLETLGQIPFFGAGWRLLQAHRRVLVGNWTSEETRITVQKDGLILVQGNRDPMTLERFKRYLNLQKISPYFLGKIEAAAQAATVEKAKKKGGIVDRAQTAEREDALWQFANGKAYLTDPRAIKYLDRYAGGHVTQTAGDTLNNHYAFSSTKHGWYLHRVDNEGDVWRYALELPASGGFTVVNPDDPTQTTQYADIPSMLKEVCHLTDEEIETNTFESVWDRGFQA